MEALIWLLHLQAILYTFARVLIDRRFGPGTALRLDKNPKGNLPHGKTPLLWGLSVPIAGQAQVVPATV